MDHRIGRFRSSDTLVPDGIGVVADTDHDDEVCIYVIWPVLESSIGMEWPETSQTASRRRQRRQTHSTGSRPARPLYFELEQLQDDTFTAQLAVHLDPVDRRAGIVH